MALLWVLILCLCGLTGNGGHLLISGKYPHTINTLSLTTHVDAKIVKAAIDLYVSLGMMTISIDSEGRTVYTVTNWD